MPSSVARRGAPRDYLTSRGKWPIGPFKKDTPAGARCAAAVAANLLNHLENTGMTRAELTRATGLGRTTIYDLLVGAYLPDLNTIAVIEQALGVQIWPTSTADC